MKIRILILAAASALLGLMSGAVIGVTSSAVYLLFVSPAIAALATGWLTGKVTKSVRVSGLAANTVIGVMASSIAFAALLGTTFQMQIAAEITEISSHHGYSDTELERQIATWKQKVAGTEYAAFAGARIKSGARLTSGVYLNLGAAGNSIVLLLELLGSIATTLWLTRRQGREPFCDQCDRWFSRRIVGSAPLGSQSTIAAALKEGQFHKLGRRLSDPKLKNPVLLHGRFCDTCNNGKVYLELELGGQGKRPHRLRELTITHAELDDILESQAMN